jgi:PAS domain S-box-containing protein
MPDITAKGFDDFLAPLRNGDVPLLQFTTRHQRKDGSSYPVETFLELTDEDHPVFVAVARDISERLNNEQQLKVALQVIEASPLVSFRWRATADWPIDYVSANITRWGYTVAQMLAGTPRYIDIIHPDDLSRVIDDITHHTAQHLDVYTQEYRVRAVDDHYFWVEDHTRIVRHADGEPQFHEGVVSDIDAKKQAELQLAANLAHQTELNKKLEEAHNQLLQSEKMASIGQLAAGVAHELNNPIGFVHSNIGTLEGYLRDIFQIADAYELAATKLATSVDFAPVQALMAEKDFNYIKNDIFQLVDESKDGLLRVKKIVQDLKDFSRPGESDWQWSDLHAGLDSTLNIAWNEIKYKATVTKHYAPDLPQINCLPSQLNQVFMNLLVNAAHAIETTGEITITTERAGDKMVRILISDNGKGIPPDNLKRVFEPFFTTKPVGKGTGLGLSIAWGIIAKHHGQIEVTSTPGQGSTFTITLPTEPIEAIDEKSNAQPSH